MKKIFFLAVITVFTFNGINAQDNSSTKSETNFGVKAGYGSVALRVSVDGSSVTEDVSGFYIGAFAEFSISEKFGIQPELNYASYSDDGANSAILIIPILAKYNANQQFSLFAGPQFDYLANEEDAQGLKRLGLGLALGAAYDITDNIFVDVRYSFGLTDRIDADFSELDPVLTGFDLETRFNYFQIGLGYRF